MQRLEAKKSTRETVMPAETGNLKTVDENPRRNGLFSIDDGLRGSGRLDSGHDRDRTCDPLRFDPAEISRCNVVARLDIHQPALSP